jgi:glycosyltransferase involved in cell wall biosynthesis
MAQRASALRALGCEVNVQPWGRRREREPLRTKIVQRMADVFRVWRTLRRQSFDLLLVDTSHDRKTLARDIVLLVAVRPLCPKVVLQFNGSSCHRLVGKGLVGFKLASRLLVKLSDACLVLSSEERRQWQAFEPRGRFYEVRYTFVPPARLEDVPERSRLGLPANDPVVLFVGRLIEAKGVRELAAVLPRVPFHLLVAGEGPLEHELRDCAANTAVGRRLTLAGYLSDEALNAAYQVADIFVLPTTHAEGFPRAVLEAMGAGLPVVTTRIRGMADHLQEGINALFVPPRDSAALAAALTRLMSDPQLRARMGQANRQKIREFAPDVSGQHLFNVLRAVIDC